MADSFLLADWTTIAAPESVSSVPQPATQWLELPEEEDVLFWLEVKEVTSDPSLGYDTSPARQDASMVALVSPFALSVGVRRDIAQSETSAVPVARFVRWRLVRGSGAGTWGATFRIWVAAHAYA